MEFNQILRENLFFDPNFSEDERLRIMVAVQRIFEKVPAFRTQFLRVLTKIRTEREDAGISGVAWFQNEGAVYYDGTPYTGPAQILGAAQGTFNIFIEKSGSGTSAGSGAKGESIAVLDLDQISRSLYIDTEGNVVAETLEGVILHELMGHAFLGLEDAALPPLDFATPDNFLSSPNVEQINEYLRLLDLPERLLYAGYDSGGVTLELGRDYTRGNTIRITVTLYLPPKLIRLFFARKKAQAAMPIIPSTQTGTYYCVSPRKG